MASQSRSPSSIDAAAFWYRRAVRVQRKVNCGWWLQSFCPALCGLSTVGAGVMLTERYLYAHSGYSWASYGIAVAIAMLICWWWVRPRFYSQRDGLVHLEVALRLHNRLSAAHAGVGPWPPAQVARDGLRWRLYPLVWPLALALILFNAAAWLPMQPPLAPLVTPTHPPVAWEHMDAVLNALEQSELLQDKAIENFRNPLTQLQQQSPEQWYTHHNLEASETLRTQLEHTLEQLEHDLQQMTSVIDKLNQPSESHSKSLRELREPFNQTRDQLALGRMPLNEQLLDVLDMIDPNSLQGLSQSELESLKTQLRQGAVSIREARRRSRHGRSLVEDRRRMSLEPCWPEDHDCMQAGQMSQPGRTNGGPAGQGGITRGPGSAPLALDPRPQQTSAGRIEVIRGADTPNESDDYTRKFSRSAPDVDRSQAHALSLGGEAPTGEGRDTAVWKQTFTPEERDVLQRFFK